MRRRKRGITYVEVVVAIAFLGICSATLADSLNFSLQTIAYTQRRSVILRALQGSVDEIKANALTALPGDATNNGSVTMGGRTITISQTTAKVTGMNVTKVTATATWPEVKGSRFYTDTMTLECYVRGPDAQ